MYASNCRLEVTKEMVRVPAPAISLSRLIFSTTSRGSLSSPDRPAVAGHGFEPSPAVAPVPSAADTAAAAMPSASAFCVVFSFWRVAALALASAITASARCKARRCACRSPRRASSATSALWTNERHSRWSYCIRPSYNFDIL